MNLFIAGSVSDNIGEEYKKEDEKLVDLVIENNFNVIVCADLRGMIGSLYTKMKELNKNKITLTVPKVYLKYSENIKDKIDIITENINERTQKSIEEADGFLFMPGGIGTTYELLSCIETKRAGEHSKKIVIVNLFGYYNDFLKMIDSMEEKGFVNSKDKKVYDVVNTVKDAIEVLKK